MHRAKRSVLHVFDCESFFYTYEHFSDVGQFVTTITLDHTLFTGLTHPPKKAQTVSTTPTEVPVEIPNWTPSRPVIQPQSSSVAPPFVNNKDRFVDDLECGIPDYKAPTTTGLIIGGQSAHRGQFPWLAAYYHNGHGDSGFICGGP